MRKFKLAACLTAAAMMILSLGRTPTAQASQADLSPAAVQTNSANYYAYLPNHSIYFVDAGEGFAWAYRAIDYLAGAAWFPVSATTCSRRVSRLRAPILWSCSTARMI